MSSKTQSTHDSFHPCTQKRRRMSPMLLLLSLSCHVAMILAFDLGIVIQPGKGACAEYHKILRSMISDKCS